MKRGPVSAIIVIALVVVGAALGRDWLRAPSLPASTDTAAPFQQCMTQALSRRIDPVEARHTCHVIAASL
jgi:hypothetical protein